MSSDGRSILDPNPSFVGVSPPKRRSTYRDSRSSKAAVLFMMAAAIGLLSFVLGSYLRPQSATPAPFRTDYYHRECNAGVDLAAPGGAFEYLRDDDDAYAFFYGVQNGDGTARPNATLMADEFKKQKWAAFDYDATIAVPPYWIKSDGIEDYTWPPRHRIPYWFSGGREWVYTFGDAVPTKLRQLHEDGYRIVFLTNQQVLSGPLKCDGVRDKNCEPDISGAEKQDFWKAKIKEVMCETSRRAGKIVPITVVAAIAALDCPSAAGTCDRASVKQDKKKLSSAQPWAKPCTGMWDALVAHSDVDKVDCAHSFYVGDFAGRTQGTPKDSAGRTTSPDNGDPFPTDWQFALNIGIGFHTPEEVFLEDADQQDLLPKAADYTPHRKATKVTPENACGRRKKEGTRDGYAPGCEWCGSAQTWCAAQEASR